MNYFKKKVLIWGTGYQSLVLQRIIEDSPNAKVSGFMDTYLGVNRINVEPIRSFNELSMKLSKFECFIVGVGGENGYARTVISEKLLSLSLKPISAIHPTAYIDRTSLINQGIQMMPGSIIHSNCTIGDWCIVNTNATLDHNSVVGRGVHIMGSAAIAGGVIIEDFATIGTNATILPNLRIGKGSFIGAGAVVTHNVADYEIVTGNPAKFLRKNELEVLSPLEI